MTLRAVAGGSGAAASIKIGNPVSGGAANAVLYEDASQNLAADGTNFLYSATLVNSAPGLQIGSGNIGLYLGKTANNTAGLYNTSQTPSATTYFIQSDSSGTTTVNSISNNLILSVSNSSRVIIPPGAGAGAYIQPGTATGSNTQVLSMTQTRNYNTTATDYIKGTFTLTSTHANDNLLAFYDGTPTLLFSISKAGVPNVQSGGSTTISTGVGSVKMSTGNAATNTSWIPISYAGTVYYVPGWTTNAP